MIDESLDGHFMSIALREAERGLYSAHPNPRVGCILVKNNEIVGRGFHLMTGTGHAEANALADAGSNAAGSTAYCTLEPCSFSGRTPSCAEALIEAGVSRLVCAMTDPHPKNQGVGFEKLRVAGIKVTVGVLEDSARALNPGHVRKYEVGMPYVRLKLAMSLDGKTALANGESHWITGSAARQDVQRLRARSSAIITGVQTVVDDDPQLTVRASELGVEFSEAASKAERKIVVLDPERRIPRSAQLLANEHLILATLDEPANDQDLGVDEIQIPDNGERRIDLEILLGRLAAMDCNEVLFECGATLAGSLINNNLIDELVVYVAPKLMGDQSKSLMNLEELVGMSQAPALEFTDIRRVGQDLRITAILKDKE